MNVHIYTPTSTIGRSVRYCSTCRAKRRFLLRFYGYYPTQFTCGGCGYVFVSGEGRQQCGKKERRNNITFVREHWSNAMTVKNAIRQILKTT